MSVEPGETATARFGVDARDLARWDDTTGEWAVDAGDVVAHVGASSRDLRGSVTFTVRQPNRWPPTG